MDIPTTAEASQNAGPRKAEPQKTLNISKQELLRTNRQESTARSIIHWRPQSLKDPNALTVFNLKKQCGSAGARYRWWLLKEKKRKEKIGSFYNPGKKSQQVRFWSVSHFNLEVGIAKSPWLNDLRDLVKMWEADNSQIAFRTRTLKVL